MRPPRSSFEILVRFHARELYACGLCRDGRTAEVLVQECLLRARGHLEPLRDSRALSAWLCTILRREHARLYQRPLLDTGIPGDLERAGQPTYDTSAEAFSLRQALTSLPEGYREPLLLQVLGGFSCAEIAEIMELTSGTVMTRVSRTRHELRELLMPEVRRCQPRSGSSTP